MTADTIIRVAARGEGVTADGRHAALTAPGRDRAFLAPTKKPAGNRHLDW